MPMIFTDATSFGDNIVYANSSFIDLTGYGQDEANGFPSLSPGQFGRPSARQPARDFLPAQKNPRRAVRPAGP